jgi:hypothetical protein
VNDARIPERIKAKKSTINTIELGAGRQSRQDAGHRARSFVEHRADVTVKAIQKAMAANTAAAR